MTFPTLHLQHAGFTPRWEGIWILSMAFPESLNLGWCELKLRAVLVCENTIWLLNISYLSDDDLSWEKLLAVFLILTGSFWTMSFLWEWASAWGPNISAVLTFLRLVLVPDFPSMGGSENKGIFSSVRWNSFIFGTGAYIIPSLSAVSSQQYEEREPLVSYI